jgi:hypothetical protein
MTAQSTYFNQILAASNCHHIKWHSQKAESTSPTAFKHPQIMGLAHNVADIVWAGHSLAGIKEACGWFWRHFKLIYCSWDATV